MILSEIVSRITNRRYACALLLGLAVLGSILAPGKLAAQIPTGLLQNQSAGQSATPFQGSVATGEVSAQAIDLSLDEAVGSPGTELEFAL